MLNVCFGCNKQKRGKEEGDHFCRTLNLFICARCYRRDQHDLYCGDPDVPLRVYPSQSATEQSSVIDLSKQCRLTGHRYTHLQELGYTFIYCRQCENLTCVPLHSNKQTYSYENMNILYFSNKHCKSAPQGHKYQHLHCGDRTVLYCSQCANLVYL